MAEQDAKAISPADHKPTKADIEEDVSIDTTSEAPAWAVTLGDAERLEEDAVDR